VGAGTAEFRIEQTLYAIEVDENAAGGLVAVDDHLPPRDAIARGVIKVDLLTLRGGEREIAQLAFGQTFLGVRLLVEAARVLPF
jgi:hypothetical protein